MKYRSNVFEHVQPPNLHFYIFRIWHQRFICRRSSRKSDNKEKKRFFTVTDAVVAAAVVVVVVEMIQRVKIFLNLKSKINS